MRSLVPGPGRPARALDDDVRPTRFSAGYARGPLIAGLVLSHGRGIGNYAVADSGRVTSSVTGLFPWLGCKLTERSAEWGVTGYGAGGMMLKAAVSGTVSVSALVFIRLADCLERVSHDVPHNIGKALPSSWSQCGTQLWYRAAGSSTGPSSQGSASDR